MSVLLDIRDLQVSLATEHGPVFPVQGADLTVKRGETLCLVGESGCGKSVSMLAVLGLLPTGSRIQASRFHYDGQPLLSLSAAAWRKMRGPLIGMIFQDAMAAFNPVLSIGDQLSEPLRVHKGLSRRQAWKRAVEWLERVGIVEPGRRARFYPHEFSGGMLQRAMIAMALICEPHLLIADEPTTALDVSVQAEILQLLRDLQRDRQLGLVMITHDLGVVAEMADTVAVMYAGRTIEQASAARFFQHISHPYSKGLLACTPNWRTAAVAVKPIAGLPPPLSSIQEGCAFRFRCQESMQICVEKPLSTELEPGHSVACWNRGRIGD
jgi:peptide/nickel transport system ATP-binding protein